MKQKWISLGLMLMLFILLPNQALAVGVQPQIPMSSDNLGDHAYGIWGHTVCSYLYEDRDNLVRVEYIGGNLIVERYNSFFELLDMREIQLDQEFPLWGGFYAGEDFNYVIVGQENLEENDNTEVIRVIQYDKDWNRLGQAGLFGANTIEPFDAGSLRCAEYEGMLYVRTSHSMYTNPEDGLNHQANLTFSVREDDMVIEDAYYLVQNSPYGYVSHSFNQFVLVDQDGYFVALDQGDAYPRAAVLQRKNLNGRDYRRIELVSFSGETGDNVTDASLGGLAETREGYITAYDYQGSRYLSFTPKNDFSEQATETRCISDNDASMYNTPMLVPTGLDGGYVLWYHLTQEPFDWYGKTSYEMIYELYCTPYNAKGELGETFKINADISDCQPIRYNGKMTWYVTDDSAPVFYTLDESGFSAYHTVLDDVSPSDWYYPAVKYVYGRSLMNGVSETVFGPNRNTTRATIVTILWRLDGSPEQSRSSLFSDIPTGQWYTDAVAWALENGIVRGYSDSLFGPNDPITREQLAAILYRYAQYKGYDTAASADLSRYTDLGQLSEWAQEAMAWANSEGIISGTSAVTLAPKDSATRAQVAALIMRFCENLTP